MIKQSMKSKNRVAQRERREAILVQKRKAERDAYLNSRDENTRLQEEMEKAQVRLNEVKERRAQLIKQAQLKEI